MRLLRPFTMSNFNRQGCHDCVEAPDRGTTTGREQSVCQRRPAFGEISAYHAPLRHVFCLRWMVFLHLISPGGNPSNMCSLSTKPRGWSGHRQQWRSTSAVARCMAKAKSLCVCKHGLTDSLASRVPADVGRVCEMAKENDLPSGHVKDTRVAVVESFGLMVARSLFAPYGVARGSRP